VQHVNFESFEGFSIDELVSYIRGAKMNACEQPLEQLLLIHPHVDERTRTNAKSKEESNKFIRLIKRNYQVDDIIANLFDGVPLPV